MPASKAMLADVATRLQTMDKVPEIDCGTGGMAIRLVPAVAQRTATDFSAGMVTLAQAKPAGRNVTFKLTNTPNTFGGGQLISKHCALQI